MAKATTREVQKSRWGIILAGGEGSRLKVVTDRIGGNGCPKQFCRLLSDKTLYEETRERALHLFPTDHLMTVVTRSHATFFEPDLTAVPGAQVVVQPETKGTAPAIVYALLRVLSLDRDAEVAILPSDHSVSDSALFMNFVAEGFEAIQKVPNQVVLLGISATAPETGYGWIEAETASEPRFGLAIPVRRFWEKPTYEDAAKLWRRGCLWNSFVLIARASWLLGVVEEQCPELVREFSALRSRIGTQLEEFAAERIYRRLSETDLSRHVLMGTRSPLSVIRVHGVKWSDLGDPRRLAALTRRDSCEPGKPLKSENYTSAEPGGYPVV